MRTFQRFIRTRIPRTATLVVLCLAARLAWADTVNAVWNSATDVPVTANGYTATGNTVNFTLHCALPTGTDLVVVKDTALEFIVGTFDNLVQGQPVALSYGGAIYRFVANYYGGTGNDLVLVWASQRPFAWGYNNSGQLGDNTLTNRLLPVPVTVTGVLAGKTPVALAAGYFHSLALCSDGTVAAWGSGNSDSYGLFGDNGVSGYQSLVPVAVNTDPSLSALYGKTVVGIAAGWSHSLALCSDGTPVGWGTDGYGELGDNGNPGSISFVPVSVNRASGVSALYGKTVVAIAAGWRHSVALCSDGTVAAWGRNYNGQLGDGTTTDRRVPVAVNTDSGSALHGKTVVAISAGGLRTLALCSDGTIAAWGSNGLGQLGDGTKGTNRLVPVAANADSGSALYGKTVVAIAAGDYHSLALCSDGTVAAWGANTQAQLGDNGASGPGSLLPVAVNTDAGLSALFGRTVVAIEAGDYHSLAQCSDGTVVAWGRNYYGQLGDNTTTDRYVPVAVNTTSLAAGQHLTRIFVGPNAHHSLALGAAPPALQITLNSPEALMNSAFQFTFTNTPGGFFGVLATTNPSLPLSNWTSLTGLTEVSPGQFQFTDPQPTNTPQRFYRVRSP